MFTLMAEIIDGTLRMPEGIPDNAEAVRCNGLVVTVYEHGDQVPVTPVVTTMPSITPRQIRHGLTAINMRASVEAAVAASSQDVKDWWEYATEFDRNHATVIAMAAQIGVTSEQLDALWALSATL